jgi:L-rhamnose mutarotase
MKKVAIVMQLKPECRQDYIDVHRKENVWQEIIDVNRRAGVSREQIFLHDNTIFLYAEAENIAAMEKIYDEDAGLAKWNKITFGMMVSNSDDPNDVATKLEHIYDYRDGALHAPE